MPSANGKPAMPDLTTIPPEPMPLAPQVLQVQADNGAILVLVRVSTAAGVAYYFLTPDEALHLAGELRKVGESSKAGLSLPGRGMA